jgi:ubiquinone biosynthesis UbiH/UbiF/VisC/COQ6 family hydroxylase
MTDLTCDVLVAGGGLVGATAALALVRRGLSVVLVDRGEPTASRGRLGFDVRTVAVNPASVELLEELGVWRSLVACPFDRVHVCEELGTRFIEFAAEEVERKELGWIVEMSPSVTALWSALRGETDLTIVTGAIDAVTPAPDSVQLVTGDTKIAAALLIAADGANSSIRKHLGVDTGRFETGQAAIATVIETERDHHGTAWQCFLRDGPLALLPLPARDGKFFSSVVWTQSEAAAAARQRLDDAAFATELERACRAHSGAVRAVDQRFSFPLEQLVAASFQPADRVLLIGDAARVLHPLAGQGVNLGFEDIREIVRVAGRVPPAELGAAELWRGFVRRRQLRAQLMVRAMDTFATAYRVGDPGLQWLRNVAVDLLNKAPPLKRALIKEALGFGIFAPPT